MEGMGNRGGDGGGGRTRVVITATGDVQQQQQQQEEEQRGIADVNLGGGTLPERRTGDQAGESSTAAAASTSSDVLSVMNNPYARAIAPVGDVARVVNQQQRPAELIMENVWLPWCAGREFIEFAAALTDLSKAVFEA